MRALRVNINKKTLQENLQKKYLVGRRIVYDTLINSGKSAHDFVITSELILSCKCAYSEYNNELTKKKENTTTTKNIEKKKAVFEQSTEPERQKMSLENSNEIMEKDADEYLTDDEENKVIQFLVSGNKLRKVVKVNIAKIKTLEAEIQNLERKLKEMPAN